MLGAQTQPTAGWGRQVNGTTASAALWYTSRATGVIALVLLTAVLVLGIMVSRQGRLPGLPRFAGTSLHRSVSLLSVVFVAVHIATAIADPFVTIGIAASVVPFISPYEPFWLGIGAVSVDLMLALVVTSLLRARIGRRTWRAVHWLAYGSWPVAVVHSIYSSQDMQRGPLLGLALACILAVLTAGVWRAARALAATPRARRVPELMADPDLLTRAGHR